VCPSSRRLSSRRGASCAIMHGETIADGALGASTPSPGSRTGASYETIDAADITSRHRQSHRLPSQSPARSTGHALACDGRVNSTGGVSNSWVLARRCW
jgi:hypothetical protein